MSYSIPYLVLLGILSVLAFTNDLLDDKLRARMWIPCFFLLLVFFGLRGYVGDDWTGYHAAYSNIHFRDIHLNVFGHHSFRYEPGFGIFTWAVRQVAGPHGYLFFQFLCTLIQLILLFRFLRRYCQNLPFALIIFIAMSGMVMLINTMRNTIAILIFLNSLTFIQQRKALPYFLCCLAALSFHLSSILFFPLYFVLHKNIPKWLYLAVFLLGNAIVLFQIPVFSMGVGTIASLIGGKLQFMVNAYLGDSHMANMSFSLSIGSLERLGTGLIIFIFWNRLKAIRPENVMFINAMLLYFLFYLFFSEIREVGKRMAELFVFGYWILWPDLLKCFSHRIIRLSFGFFLVLYCGLKVVGTIGYPNTRYENVITGHTPYQRRAHQHRDDVEQINKSLQNKQ